MRTLRSLRYPIGILAGMLLTLAPQIVSAQAISIGLEAGISRRSTAFRQDDGLKWYDTAGNDQTIGYNTFSKGICLRTDDSKRLIVEFGFMYGQFKSSVSGAMYSYSSHTKPNPARQYFERKNSQFNLTIQYRLPGFGNKKQGAFRLRHALGPGATSMQNVLRTTTYVYSRDTSTLELTKVDPYQNPSLWLGLYYSPSVTFAKHIALFGTLSYQFMIVGDGNVFRERILPYYGIYASRMYPNQLVQGVLGIRYIF